MNPTILSEAPILVQHAIDYGWASLPSRHVRTLAQSQREYHREYMRRRRKLWRERGLNNVGRPRRRSVNNSVTS